MASPLPINTRVFVRISKCIASGLLGEVGDARAIVRTREVAWTPPGPLESYIDKTLPALVIGYNAQRDELELSLRLAERDPWDEVAATYAFGKMVTGTVARLIPEGAFIEIEPGVEGYLPKNELLPESDVAPNDPLWIGDYVFAKVMKVEAARRRLLLSTREPISERSVRHRDGLWVKYQEAPDAPTLGQMLSLDVRLRLKQNGPDTVQQQDVRALDVLAVEDNADYRCAQASFLENQGCRVTLVEHGAAALASVDGRAQPFDLILIDWSLDDMTGYDLLSLLLERRCASRLAMVMEDAHIAGRGDIWQRLAASGADVLLKKNHEGCRAAILEILAELRGMAPLRRHFHTPDDGGMAPPQQHEEMAPGLLLPVEGESAASILARLCADAGASTALLLRGEPARQRIVVEAACGDEFPINESDTHLGYSPLGDVLYKKYDICEDVRPGPGRFDMLLAKRVFTSFIGMPVPGPSIYRFAVVLLKANGSFSAADAQLAEAAAGLIGENLSADELLRVLQPWQAQYLAGQVTASAIHEINNKIVASDLRLQQLGSVLAALRKRPGQAISEPLLRDLQDSFDGLAAVHRDIAKLRDQYLGVTVADDPQPVDVNQIARDMAQLVKAEARHQGLEIETQLCREPALALARPSELRQVFLNLILNAAQQTESIKRIGTLVIKTTLTEDTPRLIDVRFSDEGPGIHAQRWENIFAFGVTTRKRGAGLGLTVSRQTANRLGGTLYVEQSYVLWGTTFLLRLPLAG